TGVVHAAPPARDRSRDRERLSPPPPPPAPEALRQVVRAIPRLLRPTALQPPLRRPPGAVVRAEPSRRGLRGDVRGVARAGLELARAVRRVAGPPEARVRGRDDAGDRRGAAARRLADPGGPALAPPKDPAPALRGEAAPLRSGRGRLLRPRP